MRAQLVQKIADSRDEFTRHFRLEQFQCSIPSCANQRRVNLSRLRCRSRLVGSFQVEQLAPSTPLYARRPMFDAQCFTGFAVGWLENCLMPVADICLARISLGHFLATFLVHL